MKNKTLAMMLFMLMSMAASVVLTSCGDDEEEVTPGGGNGKAPSGVKAVDLGLPSGTLWANMNVGANSEEAPGNFYAWGETEVKTNYSSGTYTYSDSPSELPTSADAAYVNWGSQWRMPSIGQLTELRTTCLWIWTTLNDVKGCKVVGPNGNSIFLPAAGYRYDTSLGNAGSYGFYWSRSLRTVHPDDARGLYFYSDNVNTNNYYRSGGRSVRPVRLSE